MYIPSIMSLTMKRICIALIFSTLTFKMTSAQDAHQTISCQNKFEWDKIALLWLLCVAMEYTKVIGW